ncbi:MAG: signal peptidase I [Candidatus Hadarchaeales archaeon]
MAGFRKLLKGFLAHGTVRWFLELLLILGVLYFALAGMMILIFRTNSYWMGVISGSMKHEDEGWREYFENGRVREAFLITEGAPVFYQTTYDTKKFPIQGGFERGDLLIIQGVSSVAEISVGDVIIIDRRPRNPIALTHRVLGVWQENGKVRFTTKGDHNPYLIEPDDIVVLPEKIVGKVIFVVPKLGFLSLWSQGK